MRMLSAIVTVGIAVLCASAMLHISMFVALNAEPWDSPYYTAAIGLGAGCAGFWKPRDVAWTCVAVILGQFVGWLVCAALFEPPAVAWWQVVAGFTIPFFVLPVVGATALAGAAVGHMLAHLRGRCASPRDGGPSPTP